MPVLNSSALRLGEAADTEHVSGGFAPGSMIPNMAWREHSFTVLGREVRHRATHKGKVFYDATARITKGSASYRPGFFFDRTREDCEVYIDDVVITRIGRAKR
jgi:hypothetical protein